MFPSECNVYIEYLLVRAASPTSEIWRTSKLSDLREESPDNFLNPPSSTAVNDKFKLSRLAKPIENKPFTKLPQNKSKGKFTEQLYCVLHTFQQVTLTLFLEVPCIKC